VVFTASASAPVEADGYVDDRRQHNSKVVINKIAVCMKKISLNFSFLI